MKICFLTNEGFPNGMAQSSRILSLAKGLIKKNISVKVYCIQPTESKRNQFNYNKRGECEGVSFVYTTSTLFWPKRKIEKLIVKLIGVLLFLKEVIYENKIEKIDYFIFTTSDYCVNYILVKYLKLLKINVVLSVDEYPYVLRSSKKYNKYYVAYFINNYYKMFDSYIVITNILINYLKDVLKTKKSFLLVPISVDPDRFPSNIAKQYDFRYIAYCGNIGMNQKDGVDILIKAFKAVSIKYPEIKLLIIGSTSAGAEKQTFSNLKNLVNALKLDNSVIFTGKINREKLPNYLSNADLLVLARPNNLQAHGGFPTKLGEYLCTKKPVLVTDVGEIRTYLENGVSAYIVEPNNERKFSVMMLEIIKNYDEAKRVGNNGYKVAINNFHYQLLADKIVAAIKGGRL